MLNIFKLALMTALTATLMVGCSSTPTHPSPVPPASASTPNSHTPAATTSQTPSSQTSTAKPTADPAQTATKPGGYYLDDGPEANPPTNLDEIPDAEPKKEPLNTFTNKPYVALGETYVPMTAYKPFSQTGIASWYGKRFHGRKTASGEKYNMYAMTAAHPTLPLPSYVKVTNPSNDRSVIVRINDRGPFKHSRIIDLSYAAAHKLRIIDRGSAPVSIEAVNVDAFTEQTKSHQLQDSKLKDSKLQVSTRLNSSMQTEASPLSSNNPNANQNTSQNTSQSTYKETTANKGTQFFVQVGAFKQESNADSLHQKLQKLSIANNSDIKHVYNGGVFRIKLGPYATSSKAQQVAADIRKKLNISTVIRTQ